MDWLGSPTVSIEAMLEVAIASTLAVDVPGPAPTEFAMNEAPMLGATPKGSPRAFHCA